MLVLTEREMESVIGYEDMAEAVEVLRRAYRHKNAGRVSLAQRLTLQYPPGRGYYTDSAVRILSGIVPDENSAALRIYPISHGNRPIPDTGGRRQLDYTIGQELVLYYRYAEAMQLAALMADYRMMNIRTSAPTGLATDLLAREDSETLGVLGAGRHAPWQIASVCAVRPIRRVKVFSPTPANRERVAAAMGDRLDGCAVEASSSAEEAVTGADVVVTVTSANEPVLDVDWLRRGAHVNVVARGEIDEGTLLRADRIACSWKAQITDDTPPFEPVASLLADGRMQADSFLDLDEILCGDVPGRATDDDLTVFLSQGTGLWDAAIASWAYQRAVDAGSGTPLDLAG